MKLKSRTQWTSLGELIVALFEETKKVSSDPVEQKFLVYAALNDLLRKKGHSGHPQQLAFLQA